MGYGFLLCYAMVVYLYINMIWGGELFIGNVLQIFKHTNIGFVHPNRWLQVSSKLLDIVDYNLHNYIRYDVHNILVLTFTWMEKQNQ